MSARRTARNVYARALIAAGMTESGLLLVMAEALRAAERRKSASFLEMVVDVLDHLEGSGITLPLAETIRDIHTRNDPPHVVREHLGAVDDAAELVLQEDATFLHATKKANRERLAALMKALASAQDEGGGNVKPFPAPAPHSDDIDEAVGLVEAGRTASEISKGIRNHAATKLQAFRDLAESKKRHAAERAATDVDEFLKGIADVARETLIGEFRGPEIGRKPLFVRLRGAASMLAFQTCVSRFDDCWAETVRGFKTSDLLLVLPDQTTRTPVYSLSLPEASLPKLSRWEKAKLHARSMGTKAAIVLGSIGSAMVYYLGFDVTSLNVSNLVATLNAHPGPVVGTGMLLLGAIWGGWSRWTSADARLKLEAHCVGRMVEQRKELIALLTKPFDDSVEATVKAYEDLLAREIEAETAVLGRIEKTASDLGFKAKARAKSGGVGTARKSA